MSEHVVFHRCPDRQKEVLRSYWFQKVPRIERLLARFPEDQRELRLTVTCKPKRYDVHAVLLLPTGSLAAGASSQFDRQAIDTVVDKLVAEVRRHKDVIRHEDQYRRKQRRKELSHHAATVLQPAVSKPDKETFFNLLSPVMARLEDHARHELLVAELQGRIGREQVTATDLLDETILHAWEQFSQKEQTEPLEIWLTRLLHDVLDEQVGPMQATHSLYEQAAIEDPGGEAVASAASDDIPIREEFLSLTFEQILPDDEGAEPWRQVAAVDQAKWALAQLGTVSAQQRRAFTLHLLEGWEPDEIAMVQGRTVEEVRTDIEAVRQMLRDRLGSEARTGPPGS
jgi:DNA-directed RNA polymerase specialized sigma24 family protein/ribosome-associated translation inhibitor RaiA